MPGTSLNAADTAELAELLQFLSDWLTRDHEHLETTLARFVGNHAYNTRHLRNDLNRFTFQLGGNDGEPLFQPGPQ